MLRPSVYVFIFQSMKSFSSMHKSRRVHAFLPCPLFSQSLFRSRFLFQRVFTCKNRLRYSRERALQIFIFHSHLCNLVSYCNPPRAHLYALRSATPLLLAIVLRRPARCTRSSAPPGFFDCRSSCSLAVRSKKTRTLRQRYAGRQDDCRVIGRPFSWHSCALVL